MTQILGGLLAFAIARFLYILEALAVLLLVWTALRDPSAGAKWFERVESLFQRLARRQGLSVAVVGLLPLLIRAALLPMLPPRLPAIADDFAFVLAGETFALGRLTNPPHPLWTYFETPHVLQQPTYMSMYFPAQGLFMAAGKVVAGSLWVGVWISAGLMCAALCWMLQAWLPPAWALFGGLLAVMRLGLFTYWMNSYFGGAVAALGGALMLGAVPRIMRRQRVLDAVLLAVGVTILANSRPYEGLLVALPVAVWMCLWLIRDGRLFQHLTLTRVVVPIVLILSLSAAGTCYYYWRVTGNAFLMPEASQRSTGSIVPNFIWQSLRPEPNYHQAAVRAFYAGPELEDYLKMRSIRRWLETTLAKLSDAWIFYLGPALTLPLLALPRALRDRRMRLLVIPGLLLAGGLGVETWFYPHYAAPATALFYAILLQAMRHVRTWKWRKRSSGLLLVRGIPLICVIMVLARLGAQSLHFYMPLDLPPTWCCTAHGGVHRADIIARLQAQGGKHLVLVRWVSGDNPFQQWVYNEPDIDRATVVWAWETENPAELIRYYKDRQVWLVHPAEHGPPDFSPYTVQVAQKGAVQ
jgi:hypothetical protein